MKHLQAECQVIVLYKNKIKNSTGSRTGQVKNKESYNSLVKNHLSASVGRHHPMIRVLCWYISFFKPIAASFVLVYAAFVLVLCLFGLFLVWPVPLVSMLVV
eukprot:scpid54006/ scgid7854/ 